MDLPDILSKEDKKTVNKVLGLKKISRKKEDYEGMFGMLKLTWYFEKPYEKIIIVVLGLLGILRIIQWVINLI